MLPVLTRHSTSTHEALDTHGVLGRALAGYWRGTPDSPGGGVLAGGTLGVLQGYSAGSRGVPRRPYGRTRSRSLTGFVGGDALVRVPQPRRPHRPPHRRPHRQRVCRRVCRPTRRRSRRPVRRPTRQRHGTCTLLLTIRPLIQPPPPRHSSTLNVTHKQTHNAHARARSHTYTHPRARTGTYGHKAQAHPKHRRTHAHTLSRTRTHARTHVH